MSESLGPSLDGMVGAVGITQFRNFNGLGCKPAAIATIDLFVVLGELSTERDGTRMSSDLERWARTERQFFREESGTKYVSPSGEDISAGNGSEL